MAHEKQNVPKNVSGKSEIFKGVMRINSTGEPKKLYHRTSTEERQCNKQPDKQVTSQEMNGYK
jgi:hypothetical protein